MKRAKVIRSLLLSCLLTLTGNALALSDGAFRYDFIDLNRSKVRINDCSGTCPTTLVIPSEINGARVIAISDGAFFGRGLISVVIPDSVITIGNSAFRSNDWGTSFPGECPNPRGHRRQRHNDWI